MLSCVGNVIEKEVAEQLSDEAERGALQSDGQFGSRKKWSAIDAAAIMVDRAPSAWKEDNITGVLVTDIKAAFPSIVKADPCNEGQEDRWRSHTMDRELSLRENGGDGNLRQCITESPSGSRCPARLTRVADSLCDTHRWTDEVGGRESPSQRPLLGRRPWMGGNREGREPGGQKT